MINKRSLWFLTLFSLIMVLSVYYITMPSELLMATNNGSKSDEEVTTKVSKNEENAELVALRVESEEKMLDNVTELKKILTDVNATTEQKNEAFEKLQSINKNRSAEELLESKIKDEFKYKSFVSINGSNVTVVVDSTKHDKKTANKIMRLVQNEFNNPMSISVKFQK